MIRRTPVPVTYVDFHAQFPAVSKLLGCREISCAESLEFPDFTAAEHVRWWNAWNLRIVFARHSGSIFAGTRSSNRMTMLSQSGRNSVCEQIPIQHWREIFLLQNSRFGQQG
jgi:hypothetical protein